MTPVADIPRPVLVASGRYGLLGSKTEPSPDASADPPSRPTTGRPDDAGRPPPVLADLLGGLSPEPDDCDAALLTLTQVAARLREAGDGRAAFPDIYAVITRRVGLAIAGRGPVRFLEPQWISRLAGRFATRYLRALCEPETSAAWSLAAQEPGPGATPVLEATLGISAHINFDLALGIVDNIIAHGAVADPARLRRYHHDHDAVNRILAESLPECIALLADRHDCPIARLHRRVTARSPRAAGLVDALILRTLAGWRTEVWRRVDQLCAAERRGDLRRREALIRQMDRDAGRWNRGFLLLGLAFGALGPLGPLTPE